jgi:hypothetical protein
MIQNYFCNRRKLAMRRKLLSLHLAVILMILLTINPQDAHAGEVPVPEFYGIYMVSDGKLITPKDALKEKRLKTVGHLMISRFGINELSGISASQNSFFLVYGGQFKDALNRLKLGKFKFVRQVLIKGMWPAKDEMANANMWVLEAEISMNVGPVKGQTELYRLVPTSPLSDGVYAIYTGPIGSDIPIATMEVGMVADFSVGEVVANKDNGTSIGGSNIKTVIVKKKTKMRIKPAIFSDTVEVAAGTRGEYLGAIHKQGYWIKVRLPNGEEGFFYESDLDMMGIKPKLRR